MVWRASPFMPETLFNTDPSERSLSSDILRAPTCIRSPATVAPFSTARACGIDLEGGGHPMTILNRLLEPPKTSRNSDRELGCARFEPAHETREALRRVSLCAC